MLCERQHATTQHVTASIPMPPFHQTELYKHCHTSGHSKMSAVTYYTDTGLSHKQLFGGTGTTKWSVSSQGLAVCVIIDTWFTSILPSLILQSYKTDKYQSQQVSVATNATFIHCKHSYKTDKYRSQKVSDTTKHHIHTMQTYRLH